MNAVKDLVEEMVGDSAIYKEKVSLTGSIRS